MKFELKCLFHQGKSFFYFIFLLTKNLSQDKAKKEDEFAASLAQNLSAD